MSVENWTTGGAKGNRRGIWRGVAWRGIDFDGGGGATCSFHFGDGTQIASPWEALTEYVWASASVTGA